MRGGALCKLACTLAIVFSSLSARAEEKTAADILPASTVVYAEVARPSAALELLRGHPLTKRTEYEELVSENRDFLKFRAIVAYVEARMKHPWQEAIHIAAGHGVALAVDAETQGAMLLAHATDAKELVKIRDTLIKLARQQATKKGKADPVELKTYRDIDVYKLDKAVIGTFGNWLLVTNKPDLGRVVADNILDGPKDALAGRANFKAARQSITGEPLAWAYADVETLRKAGAAKKLFAGKTDNPLAELVVGGLLDIAGQTPLATVAVYLDKRQVRLALSTPQQADWVSEDRHYYFGTQQRPGVAPPPLSVKNRLLSLNTYRDVGEMWQRRSDLFDENVNAKLTEADSNLTTLFGGRDFGREILGAAKPEIQIVAVRQQYDKLRVPLPKIKLPAGAIVFQLKEPAKMQRALKVSFQSLIGFGNLAAGQQGQPQLEMRTAKRDHGQIIAATYEDIDKEAAESANNIIFNFSPTIAFAKDRFIISTTRELGEELYDLVAAAKQDPPKKSAANTASQVDVQLLREVLRDNRGQLIAQNMLEKGHGKLAAEREVDLLLAVVGLVKGASVELTKGNDVLRLELAAQFATDEE